jgi:hypothetical protein
MKINKLIQRFIKIYSFVFILSLAFSYTGFGQQRINVSNFRPGPVAESSRYRLPDGDIIMLTVEHMGNTSTSPNYADNSILLKFETDLNVTWWKGLNFILYRDGAEKKISMSLEGDKKSAFVVIPWIDFELGGYLVFLKAKAFGAHTPVYELHFSRTDMANWKRKRITFTWQKD